MAGYRTCSHYYLDSLECLECLECSEFLECLEDEEPVLADCNVRGSASATATPRRRSFPFILFSDLLSLQSLPLRRPDGNTLRRSIASSIGLPAFRIECVCGYGIVSARVSLFWLGVLIILGIVRLESQGYLDSRIRLR